MRLKRMKILEEISINIKAASIDPTEITLLENGDIYKRKMVIISTLFTLFARGWFYNRLPDVHHSYQPLMLLHHLFLNQKIEFQDIF